VHAVQNADIHKPAARKTKANKLVCDDVHAVQKSEFEKLTARKTKANKQNPKRDIKDKLLMNQKDQVGRPL
jgi:hypothetical protein